MNVTVEMVTPQIAEVWLNQNNTNREMRPGVAERYAADMKAGLWTQSIDPIGFYGDGDLANGQHRLFAVVESNTTQQFIIVRGLDRKDGLNIDTGFLRTLIDNARISGTDDGLSPALITSARAIAYGSNVPPKPESYSDKLAVVNQYREPAAFVTSYVKRVRFLCTGPVLGAIGRAYMHEADKDRLKLFCQVLGTGLYDSDTDTAAIVLRNYLMNKGPAAASSAMWQDTFRRAQNAVWNFMRKTKLSVLKATDEESYPLAKTKKRTK